MIHTFSNCTVFSIFLCSGLVGPELVLAIKSHTDKEEVEQLDFWHITCVTF